MLRHKFKSILKPSNSQPRSRRSVKFNLKRGLASIKVISTKMDSLGASINKTLGAHRGLRQAYAQPPVQVSSSTIAHDLTQLPIYQKPRPSIVLKNASIQLAPQPTVSALHKTKAPAECLSLTVTKSNYLGKLLGHKGSLMLKK